MAGIQEFHIGAGALAIDGADVGLTTENGVVVNYEPDIHLHKSGKYGNTPVKASLIGRKLELKVAMAENTFTNIANAFAGVVSEDGKIKFGGLAGVALTGKKLTLTPFDGTPAWVFRNAVPNSSIETAYKVGDERIIEVTFTAMVDMTAPEAENIAYIS